MNRSAKQVSPTELSALASSYYRILGTFGQRVDAMRDTPTNKYIIQYRLGPLWNGFTDAGTFLAQAVLGSKEIPAGQAKKIELAIRLFMGSGRLPKDPVGWFDKNLPLMNLLYDAAIQWPIKVEGESEQVFTVGPFTVHNTLGLTGASLDGIKTTLGKAVALIKALRVPGIEKVLYGDVMIVAKIQKSTTGAWYFPGEDVVYLRQIKHAGADNLHNLIHELGHRYLHKFASKEIKDLWHRYNLSLEYSSGSGAQMPEVGEPWPFPVAGIKGQAIVQRIEHGLDRYYVSETGYLSGRQLRKDMRYPTLYAAKSEAEHFCEALALRALGALTEPHLGAFRDIIEEGHAHTMKTTAQRVASRYMQRQAAQGTWAEDEIFTGDTAKKVKAFLELLIKEGKAVSEAVDAQRTKAVKGVQGGDKLTNAEVLSAAMKLVESHWGDDAMAKPLARLIAFGDYVW